jgi:flagellin-like hook-associated protein FlgL
MDNVALSGAMRSNLLSLVNTQRDIDNIQLRLATGRKVNSALDDPRNFFAAQSLNNRASDLNRLLDSMGQSISTIKEADNGVSALTALIEQADSLAVQAKEELSSGSGEAVIAGDKDIESVSDLFSLDGVGAGSNTFDIVVGVDGATASETITITSGDSAESMVAQINDNANLEGVVKASFNAAGQLEIKSLTDDAPLRIEANTVGAQGLSSLGLGDLTTVEDDGAGSTRVAGTVVAGNTLSSRAAAASSTASTTLAAAGFVTIDTGEVATAQLTVDGINSTAVTIDEDTTIQGLIDSINNDASLAGSVTASFDTDTRKIELTTNGSVSSVELTFNATTWGDGIGIDFDFGTGASDAVFGANSQPSSELITFSGGSADVTRLQKDFNAIRDQINGLVEDANYRGVNLLKGDNLETVFNEDQTNKLITEGANFTAVGLGIDDASFNNSNGIQVSIDQVRAALNTVRDFGNTIANDLAVIQTRQDFTEKTVNTLEEGSDKLTLADPNEEGAKLLSLQTRQQLSITSLALASQSQSAVLALF